MGGRTKIVIFFEKKIGMQNHANAMKTQWCNTAWSSSAEIHCSSYVTQTINWTIMYHTVLQWSLINFDHHQPDNKAHLASFWRAIRKAKPRLVKYYCFFAFGRVPLVVWSKWTALSPPVRFYCKQVLLGQCSYIVGGPGIFVWSVMGQGPGVPGVFYWRWGLKNMIWIHLITLIKLHVFWASDNLA